MNKTSYQKAAAFLAAVFLMGCSGPASEQKQETGLEVEYTVVEQEKIPEELKAIIEENKENEIRMTYEDGQALYLIRGYGTQKGIGYSISVRECSEREDYILLDTCLIGPESKQKQFHEPSYPYLVIKMKETDKKIMIQ